MTQQFLERFSPTDLDKAVRILAGRQENDLS